MASLSLLASLAPPLLLGAVCIALLGISRSVKQRPSLRRYEHTHAFSHDASLAAKPHAEETPVTLSSVATSTSRSPMAAPTTTRNAVASSAEAILQFVLDTLHHLTGLPLLMVNQQDRNLPCLNEIETKMRADKKNAELMDSRSRRKDAYRSTASWSGDEAPEEEMSDLSSDEEDEHTHCTKTVVSTGTAQSQLFDGLQFYLAVSRVRERTVRSVLARGMENTLKTLQDQKQNESIAVIQQQYPDFTCLPTRNTAVHQLPQADQRPMDLLTALKLPSAAAVAQNQSPVKGLVRAADEESRVRYQSLPSRGSNISRVA